MKAQLVQEATSPPWATWETWIKKCRRWKKYIFSRFVESGCPRFCGYPNINFSIVGFFYRAGANYGANLERARLALLDAWSEGNAIPHNRLLPIGEFGDLGLRQR
jgi:hypothetical protein